MKKLNKLGFGTAPLSGKTLLGDKYIGMGIQNKIDSKTSLEYAYEDKLDVYINTIKNITILLNLLNFTNLI